MAPRHTGALKAPIALRAPWTDTLHTDRQLDNLYWRPGVLMAPMNTRALSAPMPTRALRAHRQVDLHV